MSEVLCPFVSELLFRTKNHDIHRLSIVPTNQIWRVETLDPDAVMKQLGNLLKGPNLSSGEKLKLGFLTGYSWPLHLHLHLHLHHASENLLLYSKSQLDKRQVAESLFFWGNLASDYLRDHKVSLALEKTIRGLHTNFDSCMKSHL